MRRRRSLLLIALLVLLGTLRAGAVTTDGSSTYLVIPVAVSSASFASRIHIFNVGDSVAAVDVYYYGSDGTASPGVRYCTQAIVPVGGTYDTAVATACALGTGSHYGMLRLYALSGAHVSAYSRVSNPQGNGFSIEGFPVGNLFGLQLSVVGLKRSAVAPGYQTNCFVGSLDEPANFSIKLFKPDGSQLGSTVAGTVAGNRIVRYLDVFAAAGVATAELQDIRAEISSTDGALQALAAFCTVQNNTSFDADFRIAKSRWGGGAGSLKAVAAAAPASPFTAWVKHRYQLVFRLPDRIACAIDPPNDAYLEMQLRAPNGTVLAGESNSTSFSGLFSPRSVVNGGYDGVWILEISPREMAQPFPLSYTFGCTSANGMTRPAQLVDGVDDF